MVSGCPDEGREQLLRKDSLSGEGAFFDVEEREEAPKGKRIALKKSFGGLRWRLAHPSMGHVKPNSPCTAQKCSDLVSSARNNVVFSGIARPGKAGCVE